MSSGGGGCSRDCCQRGLYSGASWGRGGGGGSGCGCGCDIGDDGTVMTGTSLLRCILPFFPTLSTVPTTNSNRHATMLFSRRRTLSVSIITPSLHDNDSPPPLFPPPPAFEKSASTPPAGHGIPGTAAEKRSSTFNLPPRSIMTSTW